MCWEDVRRPMDEDLRAKTDKQLWMLYRNLAPGDGEDRARFLAVV